MYTITNAEVKSRLEHFGRNALEVAEKLSESGSRLDFNERLTIEGLKFATIKGILNEASAFALLGHISELEYSFEQVKAWAEFKA